MGTEKTNVSATMDRQHSMALCVALVTFIIGGILFIVGSAIYAAWTVHWSIGLAIALFALLIVLPEGTAEKYGDHTPW